MPTAQFFNYIIVRTSNILTR